jgi:hypothetical protein
LAAPFYDSNTIRDYRYYRYRYGMSGAADFKLNDSTSFFAHGIYSDLKDWGDKWYYKPVSQVLSATWRLQQQGRQGSRLLHLKQASQRLRGNPHPGRTSRRRQVLVHSHYLRLLLL